MSFPNIPPEGINPINGLDSEQVALLLLANIAFEELGLAHLINTQAEKLQGAVGTLVDENGVLVNPLIKARSLAELLQVNREVEKLLRTVVKKEMLLGFKFENVLDLIQTIPVPPSCPSTVTLNGGTVQFLGLSPDGLTWNYQLTVPAPLAFYSLAIIFPCAPVTVVSCTNSDGACAPFTAPNICGNPEPQSFVSFFSPVPTGSTTFIFSFTLNQQLPIGTVRGNLFLPPPLGEQCYDICGPVCP